MYLQSPNPIQISLKISFGKVLFLFVFVFVFWFFFLNFGHVTNFAKQKTNKQTNKQTKTKNKTFFGRYFETVQDFKVCFTGIWLQLLYVCLYRVICIMGLQGLVDISTHSIFIDKRFPRYMEQSTIRATCRVTGRQISKYEYLSYFKFQTFTLVSLQIPDLSYMLCF